MSGDTSLRRSRPNITPELLRELIDYDSATGVLTWKVRGVHHFRDGVLSAAGAASIWNGQHAGKPALSSVGSDGYLKGTVFGRLMAAHRAAYAIIHGVLPCGPIAHLDSDRANNRIANLRAGTAAKQAVSTGVYLDRGKWAARVSVDGRRQYLGRFSTRDEALAASRTAELRNGYQRAGASR